MDRHLDRDHLVGHLLDRDHLVDRHLDRDHLVGHLLVSRRPWLEHLLERHLDRLLVDHLVVLNYLPYRSLHCSEKLGPISGAI